jgi:hypothetical protein
MPRLKSSPANCSSIAEILDEAILDGKIVCIDRDGRPQFDQLFYGHW